MNVVKAFKSFLLRGDLIVIAVGLVIALAFSTLISVFTTSIINPLVTRAEGSHAAGLGWQLGRAGNVATFVDVGTFISAIIYFIVYMAVVYFAIVVPYKTISARRGVVVFGDPPALKTCPACLSSDLPLAASKCLHCASDQPSTS